MNERYNPTQEIKKEIAKQSHEALIKTLENAAELAKHQQELIKLFPDVWEGTEALDVSNMFEKIYENLMGSKDYHDEIFKNKYPGK